MELLEQLREERTEIVEDNYVKTEQTERNEMMYGKKKAFKPCATCPSPSKCKMAGKCLKKKK